MGAAGEDWETWGLGEEEAGGGDAGSGGAPAAGAGAGGAEGGAIGPVALDAGKPAACPTLGAALEGGATGPVALENSGKPSACATLGGNHSAFRNRASTACAAVAPMRMALCMFG